MIKDFVIKTYVDGANDAIFIDANNPIEIGEYTYTAQRMGAVPTITATIQSFICLDSYWNKRQYIVYNDERYFVFNTPTSSKKNSDGRYEYSVIFQSERYELNGIYFFDVVGEDSSYAGGYISNSITFSFFGTISEFAERLQASLDYSEVNYTVVLDEGISSDPVAVSFDNTYILQALQESFNLYNIPYYFKGREIHFGYTDNAIADVFEYGDSLLEVTKTNANYKQVTYCSGIGSEENIPYYYPNEADYDVQKEKMPIVIKADLINTCEQNGIQIIDYVPYSETEGTANVVVQNEPVGKDGTEYPSLKQLAILFQNVNANKLVLSYNVDIPSDFPSDVSGYVDIVIDNISEKKRVLSKNVSGAYDIDGSGSWTVNVTNNPTVSYIGYFENSVTGLTTPISWTMTVTSGKQFDGKPYDFNIDTVIDYIENILIPNNPAYTAELTDLLQRTKDNIAKMNEVVERMPIVQNLMPTLFRTSKTKERFYPAKNNTYLIPDGGGEYYYFENEYDGTIIKEQVVQPFEDIKPTIEGITNAHGQVIATVTAFAYDTDDNDDLVLDEAGNPTEEFQHPYFYIKLKKFDGVHGFDLFGSSIDSGEMTINMRSGNLAGTAHIVQSLKQEVAGGFMFYNPVQVDSSGNIITGNWQDKIDTNISNAQPQQQNTLTNEIWIAVTKDISTYGTLMPNVVYNYKPTAGDEFNITHIHLPQGYITAAEKRLEDAIIQYMWENNTEKFNFTIKFSRVFLADNPDILTQLNENARLAIKYDNKIITSYISTYSYKSPTETEPLPEITVTITDTISVQQGVLQNALTEIRNEIISGNGRNIDILKQGMKYFVRKDVDDLVEGTISFKKGIKSDKYDSVIRKGFNLAVDENGEGFLDIHRISANELIVDILTYNKIQATGGAVVVSKAWAEISSISKDSNGRVVFGYKPDDGLQLWRVGDQPQMSNAGRFFWGVIEEISSDLNEQGEHTITISEIPSNNIGNVNNVIIGDDLVLVGHRGVDLARQNVLILSSGSDRYPNPFTFYKGINSFSLIDKESILFGEEYSKIVTKEFRLENPDGTTTQQPNDRGVWVDTEPPIISFPNDRWSNNGELWLCIAPVSTTDEPSASSPNWRRETENSYNDGVNLLNDSAVTATTTRFYGIDTAEVLRDYVGKEIVLSFDAWINEGGIEREIRVYPYQNSGISILDTKDFVFTKQRQRFYLKTTVYDWGLKPDLTSGVIAFYDFAGNNSYSIANRMIEKGNAESTWRLSPEDVRADYTMVSEELSTAKANAAKVEAEAYADGIVSESEATQIRYVDAEILELETKQTAYTDGKVTDAEEEAIRLAKVYTDSAAELTQTTANAYADGIVDAEEARAIADATAKANAAQAAAEQAAMQMVEDVKVGGVNLQLHSAFTKVTDVENVVGASVSIVDGYVAMLRQGATGGGFVYCFPLTEPVDADAEVTFSFDIKRLNNNYNLVRVSPNGNNPLVDINTQDLSEVDFKRISVTFTPRQYITGEHFNYLLFELYGNGGNPDVYVSVRNIQVEKGNKMTSWKLSPLDEKREAQIPLLPPAMTEEQWQAFDDQVGGSQFVWDGTQMLVSNAKIRNLTAENINTNTLTVSKFYSTKTIGSATLPTASINLNGQGSFATYRNGLPRIEMFAAQTSDEGGWRLFDDDGNIALTVDMSGWKTNILGIWEGMPYNDFVNTHATALDAWFAGGTQPSIPEIQTAGEVTANKTLYTFRAGSNPSEQEFTGVTTDVPQTNIAPTVSSPTRYYGYVIETIQAEIIDPDPYFPQYQRIIYKYSGQLVASKSYVFNQLYNSLNPINL